jgi:hypothetical protein
MLSGSCSSDARTYWPFQLASQFPPPNNDDSSDSVVTFKRERPSRRCDPFWARGITGSTEPSAVLEFGEASSPQVKRFSKARAAKFLLRGVERAPILVFRDRDPASLNESNITGA